MIGSFSNVEQPGLFGGHPARFSFSLNEWSSPAMQRTSARGSNSGGSKKSQREYADNHLHGRGGGGGFGPAARNHPRYMRETVEVAET